MFVTIINEYEHVRFELRYNKKKEVKKKKTGKKNEAGLFIANAFTVRYNVVCAH